MVCAPWGVGLLSLGLQQPFDSKCMQCAARVVPGGAVVRQWIVAPSLHLGLTTTQKRWSLLWAAVLLLLPQ